MPDAPKYRVEREVYQSKMRLAEDSDAVAYRAVSGLAVIGLLLGLAAPLAIAIHALWLVAIAGVVVNVLALQRISAGAPALVGRKAALIGLTLSAIIVTAVPADWLCYRRLVRDEARKSAAIWFDYLRAGQPQKAIQLTLGPMTRDRLDENLWEFFREGSDGRLMLDAFIRRPAVRTLMALKDRATVRFYDTESQWSDKDVDRVYQTYAVTYPDSEGLKTFFVGLLMDRTVDSQTGHAYWQITRIEGGVKPKWLGGTGQLPKV